MAAHPSMKRKDGAPGRLFLCRMMTAFAILLAAAGAVWGNVCYDKTLPFQSVPRDRSSIIKLESRRVLSIADKTIVYDLGGKSISIKAAFFEAERFIREVAEGRCTAQETVLLIPERKSPFNDRFQAARPKTVEGAGRGNACYSKALPFQSVPRDRSSVLKLESRRVLSITDKTIVYDLGGKSIRIAAHDFGAERFMREVASGRCAAHETVMLIPESRSVFNDRFQAVYPKRD